jgi:hypothetical protein
MFLHASNKRALDEKMNQQLVKGAFLGIFWHFLAYLALNATFGIEARIEDILVLPLSRPSLCSYHK